MVTYHSHLPMPMPEEYHVRRLRSGRPGPPAPGQHGRRSSRLSAALSAPSYRSSTTMRQGDYHLISLSTHAQATSPRGALRALPCRSRHWARRPANKLWGPGASRCRLGAPMARRAGRGDPVDPVDVESQDLVDLASVPSRVRCERARLRHAWRRKKSCHRERRRWPLQGQRNMGGKLHGRELDIHPLLARCGVGWPAQAAGVLPPHQPWRSSI